MCLRVKGSDIPFSLRERDSAYKSAEKLVKIAKRDIFVFKVLDVDLFNNSILVSPYQSEKYELFEMKTSGGFGIRRSWYFPYDLLIDRGLHSYAAPKEARCYLAVIPEGAYYFEGQKGDLVSDQLVVIEKYSKRKHSKLIKQLKK